MNFKASLTTFAVVAMLGACGGDDGGVPVRDGGTAIPGNDDAGRTPTGDTGTSHADAATTPPASDAGTTPTDAAVVHADAGSMDASTDSGARDAAVVADSAVRDSGTGNTTPDAGHVADAGGGGNGATACQTCETKWCTKVHLFTGDFGAPADMPTDLTKLCGTLEGSAVAGPKAGSPRSQLCMDLVACAQRTKCAKTNYLECLCGSDDFATCQSEAVPSLKGMCRNEYLAAAETTAWSDLAGRLGTDAYSGNGEKSDPSFTTGAADLWIECDRQFCNGACNGTCDGQADGTVCADDDTLVCTAGQCPISPNADGSFGLEDPSVYDAGI